MTQTTKGYRNRLLQLLEKHYSLEELNTLCFILKSDIPDLSYDNLSGKTLEAKARELVRFVERRDALPVLLEGIKQDRPDLVEDVERLDKLGGPAVSGETPGRWWVSILVALITAAGVITAALIARPTIVQIIGTQPEDTPAISLPTPTKTARPPTPSVATPTSEPTPTHSPAPEPSPTDTETSTATLTPTPSHTPKPQADAVVLDGGADLRPGADTWWHPRQTLPTGTELELVGYDPAFPDWVFVRTADGSAEGWTQLADLQINLDLADLPRVTPRPTLTYTPSPTPVTTPVGPLKLTFYYDPGSEHCTEGGGWAVNIHFIVEGGTGVYTYFWEGEQIYGPTTEREYIHTIKWGDAALAGTGRVESGGKAVQSGVFVPKPPQCP
jgi:hypothetical protein